MKIWRLNTHPPHAENHEIEAKSKENQPKMTSFAQVFKPTNTKKPQTSESDSSSSQDGSSRLKRVSVQKSTKNLPGATKYLRLKPNFRRRRSLMTSEFSIGKQRLLSEFLNSGSRPIRRKLWEIYTCDWP